MRKPSVISLFTGAGGLDLGAHAAGLRTAVAVEMDPIACQTLRLNAKRNPRKYGWEVIERRIEDVSSDEILRAARLSPGEPDLLIGGPPCQPFSKSGYWHKGDSARLEDPRANTLWHYLRVLQDTKPKAFLLENVPGLAYSGKSEGLRFIQQELERINAEEGTRYTLRWKVLQAADYGVPQRRERIFLIGHRDGKVFDFPEPMFSDPALGSRGITEKLPPYRTAWDALGDLGEPEDIEDTRVRGKWADLLPSIPEGHNYLFHTERGGGLPLFGWRRRYWSFLLKLAKRQPSWTLTAQPGPSTGPFHWDSRRLARRELARLQTVPDDYDFVGSLSDVQRQLGNAVPSLLSEVLCRRISRELLGFRVNDEPTLRPPRRENVPAAKPRRPVPETFIHMVGKHHAHPGTGKGPGARRRASAL